MKTVLTIAGSDCSGGAGIQADIKTITMHGAYAMSAVTALTAQNTTGVYGVLETPPTFLSQQLDCIFTDIRPDAVKVGMVGSAELIAVIAQALTRYAVTKIVVDPVMVSTSGSALLRADAVTALQRALFPLATLITPNLAEAAALTGHSVRSKSDMEAAAHMLWQAYGCAVLCKGGHLADSADDLLYDAKGPRWFPGRHIANPNTHGTGCTLSSAIASQLALGQSLDDAVRLAKAYLSDALAAQLNLGAGHGPLAHNYALL